MAVGVFKSMLHNLRIVTGREVKPIPTTGATPCVGAIVVPIGALAAMWKTDSLSRAAKPENLSVPFAEGTPSSKAAAEENDR